MICVTTTIRRDGASYVGRTLASVDAQARTHEISADKILMSDGPLPVGLAGEFPSWDVRERPKSGARRNGWRCFELAGEYRADDMVLLQDDLELPCDDALAVIANTRVPDECFCLSFYQTRPVRISRPRIVLGHATMSAGAQALKFPLRSVDWLIEIGQDALGLSRDELHLFDDAVYHAAAMSRTPLVGTVVPSVIRHVGEVSACHGMGIYHRGNWFVPPGELFPVAPAELAVSRM
jgi:hypothetical protein